jgi:hypothetical protein
MSRSLRQRIERLEGDQGRPGTPNIIVATCPIPGDGQPPTMKPSSVGWRMVSRTLPSEGMWCSIMAAEISPSRSRNGCVRTGDSVRVQKPDDGYFDLAPDTKRACVL